MTQIIQMMNITKTFPGVVADDDVNFFVDQDEIHALVGENGAGKTTLMNILYGCHIPDAGQILIKNELVEIHNSDDAINLGIGMVHQHFMLVPELTVLENIILGKEIKKNGLIDYKRSKTKVQEICSKYGMEVNLDYKVYELSVGEMQIVEIVKTLYRGAQILILDEPTAVLTPQETEKLFETLRTLSSQGKTIIFISHKLKEVLAVSERVTVMRHGRVVGTVITKDTTEQELANMMVGRNVVFRVKKTAAKPGKEILRVKDLSALNDRGLTAIKGVNFNVRLGEIVGVAGVEGNGQSELVEVLTGLRKELGGEIVYYDKDIIKDSPRARREKGISHIPADRTNVGINIKCTITENLILNNYYRTPFSSWIMLNNRYINNYVDQLVDRFNISTPDVHQDASCLSGGNMQKVVLAREFSNDPHLLVASQPTRGVDVGAIEYIHSQILALRDKGHGIILVSAELDEIMNLSDRILVMYEGEIVGEFLAGEINENELGLYMAGAKRMDRTVSH